MLRIVRNLYAALIGAVGAARYDSPELAKEEMR